MEMLVVFFLAAVAMGGVVWVFVYPVLSGERQAEMRVANVAKPEPISRAARVNQRSRRDTVETTLKEIEERNKKHSRMPLSMKIEQAGLSLTKQQFFFACGGLGLALFVLGMFTGGGLLVALALGFAGAFGLPMWGLAFLKKRRQTKFLDAFPDSVDVIVRGIKAGLPLLDCLKMIATDAVEPVRSEFRTVVETQAIGMPLGEACGKLYEHMRVPEANFFGIVISIQQRAGGNLSEALGNLSRVLRDRKKMKAKITAMSQEAKASAGIIGALPVAVMILVYMSSPDYISLLWKEPMGRLMLAASVVWMSTGIFVMKKMINFDF